jgi:hypothetical protein
VGVIPWPFVTSIQVERKQLILPTVVLRGQQDLTNRKCKQTMESMIVTAAATAAAAAAAITHSTTHWL